MLKAVKYFAKHSIIDVFLGRKYVSESIRNVYQICSRLIITKHQRKKQTELVIYFLKMN